MLWKRNDRWRNRLCYRRRGSGRNRRRLAGDRFIALNRWGAGEERPRQHREEYAAYHRFAAICHAPWLLISAGLMRGRKLTSYHSIRDDIRNAGGNWVNQEVVEDDNWVTSRQPSDIPAFNEALLDLFARTAAEAHR